VGRHGLRRVYNEVWVVAWPLVSSVSAKGWRTNSAGAAAGLVLDGELAAFVGSPASSYTPT